jgi:hypothetical protein
MFFLDDQLNRRRIQDICFISSGRAEQRNGVKRWVHDVRMVDGTSLVLLDVIVAQISRVPAHAFPAELGTYIWGGGDDGGDFLSPVVGWSVSQDGNVRPLTAGGSIDDNADSPAIVLPDGHVVKDGLVLAKSLEDYKASEKDG